MIQIQKPEPDNEDLVNEDFIKDSVLLQMVANKDKRAFEVLYKRYHKRVARFTFRFVENQQIVEEVVDDTLFAIWRNAAEFQGRSRVSTWIFGIAYRRALKAVDKEKKHDVVDVDSEILEAQNDTASNSNPETYSAGRKLTERLQKAILTLSTDHKAVIELTIMGYSYGEIAEIVNCPQNTVKTRMYYARQQVKEYFTHTEPDAQALRNRRDICAF